MMSYLYTSGRNKKKNTSTSQHRAYIYKCLLDFTEDPTKLMTKVVDENSIQTKSLNNACENI